MTIRILIIHPESEMLRKLRKVLTQAGYSVITASDTITAKQILKKMKVDLLIFPPVYHFSDQEE